MFMRVSVNVSKAVLSPPSPPLLTPLRLDVGIALSHLPLESRLVFALLHNGQTPSSHEPLACGTVCIFLPNK